MRALAARTDRRATHPEVALHTASVRNTAVGEAIEADRQRRVPVAALSDNSRFTGASCFLGALRPLPWPFTATSTARSSRSCGTDTRNHRMPVPRPRPGLSLTSAPPSIHYSLLK